MDGLAEMPRGKQHPLHIFSGVLCQITRGQLHVDLDIDIFQATFDAC
jgi:hypothetical protein